jgi:CBS domain-containing protein
MTNDTAVTHIMATDLITVDVSQGLADVRRALSSERFHHLPVLEGKKLVGMISTMDLLKHSLGEINETTAGILDKRFAITDVMQRDVITVSHRASVGEAAMMLVAGGFHALPVVNEERHLLGLVTSTDLIAFLLEHPAQPAVPAETLQHVRLLEAVMKAAELYLRSGLAESEHARLERALEAARNARSQN